MKHYKQSFHVPPCRLNVKDLQDLISFLEEDIGDKKNLGVSFNSKDLAISERNLDDFLQHKELPSLIYSLTLSRTTLWSSGRNITIYIIFYNNCPAYVSVEGEDEAWVLGKSKQIKNYLISKKAKYGFLQSGKIYWSVFTIVNLISLANFLTPSSLTFHSIKVVYLISFFALFGVGVLTYLILLKLNPKRFYPYAEIKLKNNSSKSKWDLNTKINLFMLIASILAIFVTVAIFIFSLIYKLNTH